MKTKIFIIAGLSAMLFTCQTLKAQIKYGLHAAGNLETQADLGQLWNNVDLYQGFLIGEIFMKSDDPVAVLRKEFNYLSVPLLIKGNIHDQGLNDKFDLSFFTGPYIGFLTSANSNIKTGKITTSVDIDNLAEKADWGIVFGGGVSYKLANGGAILAELRYEMGLSKVDKQNPDLRNKGMGLTIGYRF